MDVLLGIFSVIAWKMLALRDAARRDDVIAPDVLTEPQKKMLRLLVPGISNQNLSREWMRAVAKLGGFLGRKGDGEPGWLTLWGGFTRLIDLEIGYNLAQAETCG